LACFVLKRWEIEDPPLKRTTLIFFLFTVFILRFNEIVADLQEIISNLGILWY